MEKKVILVTGANRGIGKEISRQMAMLNWQVVVAARKLEAATLACDQIGHEAFPVQLDVSMKKALILRQKLCVRSLVSWTCLSTMRPSWGMLLCAASI